ncbi:MAG: histidine kinase, partial [Myxococcales bacterium]|nr:histidine kinase [Myxococcales bacterium]
HFLFNALNVVRATIRRDPMRARDLISDLADLYRYLLSHPEEAAVEAEVEHAQAYLAIERARLGDERLEVTTDIDPEVAKLPVPPLLLQPLVENAVKHGVARRDGKGTVTLRARLDGDAISIEVEDAATGEPMPPTEAGAGIALATLRQRLARRYGAEASLSLTPTAQGMRATVRLPRVSARVDRRAA